MNTNTTTPRPPLPTWVWTVIVVLAIGVLIVGIVLWANRPENTSSATTAPTPEPTTSTSATPRPTTGTDVVTGCLAEGQDITMLLTTQDNAPHTKAGAVEVATALSRFGHRWPVAAAAEYNEMMSRAWAGSESYDQSQYDNIAAKNPSEGLVPDGVPFHLTAAVGRYYVESYEGDTAKVAVGLAYVIGDAVSPLYKSVATYTLVWTDNGWTLKSAERKYTPQQLFDQSLGSPYAGGC